MQRKKQSLEFLLDELQEIDMDWKDDHSEEIIAELEFLKSHDLLELKTKEFIGTLLDRNYRVYFDIFRFFLELSKDQFSGVLKQHLEKIGKSSFKKNREAWLHCLVDELHINTAMLSHVKRSWTWEDIVIERLKQGRGSAIKGQKRGRHLEDCIEEIIKNVFQDQYDSKCNFIGLNRQEAKAEFAIPSKRDPLIIFEAKAYGATGSKQTDVIGDIEKIVKVKKPATDFLFVTDGITWRERVSDLRKIVSQQNDGYILKIYTLSMLSELESDLKILKKEHGL